MDAPPLYLSTGDIARRAGVVIGTVHNWRRRGVPNPAGRRVKLTCLRVGGHWKTTEEAWQQFLADCAGPAFVEPPTERQRKTRAAASVADYWRSRGKAVPS